MKTYNFSEVLCAFGIEGEVKPFGSGHINDTFLVDGKGGKYTLQRVNTDVFTNPSAVMQNIIAVTSHIRDKVEKEGGNPFRETLNFLPAKDKNFFYITEQGDFFRAYNFIDDVNSYDMAQKPSDLYNSAKAFGLFQKRLSDFPAQTLHETIPYFHDTPKRFLKFEEVVSEDKFGRADFVRKEIEFFFDRKEDMGIVTQAIEKGEIPIRVTHNDTKLNNVLFDKKTGEALCVIDLDTVMPGSVLYDYGDSLRFGANTAAEDEIDLSKVSCSMEYFEAFTKGYLEQLANELNEKETKLLLYAPRLLTIECGMRFLTDYLEGDCYFKIHRENHNLDRARTQITLALDFEKKENLLLSVINKTLDNNK